MKKLKILLQYKYVFLIIIFIYALYITSNNIYKTNYNLDDKLISGKIINIEYKENKVVFILKGKDKVRVTYKDAFNYEIGDYVSVTGVLSIPDNNTIFNLFNYRLYLLSDKIPYLMEATNVSKIKDKNILYSIKNNIYKKIDNLKSGDYVKTFILGDKSDLGDIKTIYQENGVSHLLAISGMHISLLASILKKILNKFKYNHEIISIFLIFYAFLTNFTPSVIRASLFFILSKKIKLKDLIVILCCIMLIYNPYYLYNVGFLFSFIISFYLINFGKIANKYNYLMKLFIVSLISFLASLPILINNFYNINLISIFINLIFVPFVSFIIFPLSIVVLFLPFMDNLLCFLINIMETLSIFLNKFSINLIMCKVPLVIVLLYYLLITLTLFKPKYSILLIMLIIIHNNIKIFDKNFYLTFLDVGQGDSALLEMNNKYILIDTGGVLNSNYSIVINKTIPYLKSRGIKKLDYLILTHGDYDHMGEAINLINNFKVDNVIFNGDEYNNLEISLIEELNKKNINYSKTLELNNLYLLSSNKYDNENDNSSVIYTELNNHKFLFMGDAGVGVEEDLIEKYSLQDIDVLKVGHHGSKTSSSKSFIDEIGSKYSIISVGKNNRYGHPNDSVLDNLKNSKIYRTDQDGSIVFKIKNNKLQINNCPP